MTSLTTLESLDLDEIGITDAGLESLKALTNLRYLSLYDTPVTPEAVRQLQKVLPECEIICQTRSKGNH